MTKNQLCTCGRAHHGSKRLARQAANRMRFGQPGAKFETLPCALTPGAWIFVPTTRGRAHRQRQAPAYARAQRAFAA